MINEITHRTRRTDGCGMTHGLPFRVELWNDKDSQVIALTADYATAKKAQTWKAHHASPEN